MGIVGEPAMNRLHDDRADALDGRHLLGTGPTDPFEVAERLGEGLRTGRAEMADVEADQQVRERPVLRALDCAGRRAWRWLPRPAPGGRLQSTEPGHVGHEVVGEFAVQGSEFVRAGGDDVDLLDRVEDQRLRIAEPPLGVGHRVRCPPGHDRADVAESVPVDSYMPAMSLSRPSSRNSRTRCSPKLSMSMEPRPAKCSM